MAYILEFKEKLVKRINERIREFERNSLYNSRAYKRLKNLIEINNLETTKSGLISTNKNQVLQMDDSTIDKLLNVNTIGSEIKYAKKQGARNQKEVFEYINNRGKLETWAEENLNYLYADSKTGMESAIELEKAFSHGKGDGGLRRYDYDYIFSLINKYEKQKEKQKKLLSKSKFAKDIFPK